MSFWPFPQVFAHRGGGTVAPENTLAAMRAGLAAGYRAVEFDVMLSRDEIPVLMHDPVFGRTVTQAGSVPETLASDLVRFDAGAWFSPEFAGETVPLYADVAAFCEQHGIFMNVEIKPAPGFEEVTGRVVGEVSKRMWQDGSLSTRPLFSSFSVDALAAFAETAPDFPRARLSDRVDDEVIRSASTLGCVAIHCNQRHLDAAQAKRIIDAGFGLFCYTVNSPEKARELYDWGVNAFCTDRIDLIDPSMT